MTANIDKPTEDVVKKAVRERLRNKLIAAYQSYLNKESGSIDRLMEVVREFAYVKVYHLEYEFRKMGSAETADDWAQEVSLKVWLGLEKFVGTPESFYAWVHRIAYTQGTDAFKELKKQQDTMVGITVPSVDEDGEQFEHDNPEIYKQRPREMTAPYIPSWVEGVDLSICRILATGVRCEDPKTGEWSTRAKTYEEVAVDLNLTVSNVEQRLKRIRDRVKREKAEDKKNNLERTAAQRHGQRRG